MTPGRYLHQGDSVSGDGNLGPCMSLTAHRGAHELPGIVSSANNASASLAQCRDNAGQNEKAVQDANSDLVCRTKVVMRVYFLSLMSNIC